MPSWDWSTRSRLVGHDLAAVASLSFAYFWPMSRTLLYRELERLTVWVGSRPHE